MTARVLYDKMRLITNRQEGKNAREILEGI